MIWELSGKNSPFSDDFLGGDGDGAQGYRVVSGPFVYAQHNSEIRVWDETAGDAGLLKENSAQTRPRTHCYIDLLWEKWRKQHPTSAPYLPAVGAPGHDLASTLVFNKAGKPAPWAGSWKVQDTLDTSSLGYVYA